MPVRGLTIIVAGPDRSRFRLALTLAATQAALGARARLFLEGEAVGLVRAELDAGEGNLIEAGLPATSELLDTCLSLGVGVMLCQSGMALAGLDLRALDPRLDGAGLASMLATLGEDRLLAV